MTDRTAPPARALAFVLALIVVVVTAGLVLYALTPATHRRDSFPALLVGVPTIVAGVPGFLAWLSASSAATSAKAAADALNGQLDDRIVAATHQALDDRAATGPQDRVNDSSVTATPAGPPAVTP